MTDLLTCRAFRPAEVADADLPAGVIGRVEGFALVYDVADSFGTAFAPGSLDRTIRERVAAGKVKLFWDHGDAAIQGTYDTDLHIGVVRALENRRTADGKLGAWMTADLMDTEEARKAKQYLAAVLTAGGETGISIGMLEKGLKSSVARVDGQPVLYYTDVPLREISITAEPAVPGALVDSIRAEDRQKMRDQMLHGLIAALGIEHIRAALDAASQGDATEQDSADAGDEPDTRDAEAGDSRAVESPLATMDERLAAVRSSYSRGRYEGRQEPGRERVSRPGGHDPQRAA